MEAAVRGFQRRHDLRVDGLLNPGGPTAAALMAGDFRHGREGRAKTADFLAQLFARDPARARSLRAKARGMMAADEKSLLDRLIVCLFP